MFANKLQIIEDCFNSQGYFFKYISANDAGLTGSHQSGIYMPRDVWPLFFERAGNKGENKDCQIRITWTDNLETKANFYWYGRKTRSEYRLTNGFSFLTAENVGDVLVLIKVSKGCFNCHLLRSDLEIESFFEAFHLSPEDSCKIQKFGTEAHDYHDNRFDKWIGLLTTDFPPSTEISARAREFSGFDLERDNFGDADRLLLRWLDVEYRLFKSIERNRYANLLEKAFKSVDDLIRSSHTILNRRKSRAGFSLEHHLCYIFEKLTIPFSYQEATEGRKKPDFIFPGIEHYNDPRFPVDGLTFLAVKTTCKDRWRQILNEADRIKTKYLLTLQRGISENQLKEMESCSVRLVVPEKYKKDFPRSFQDRIFSLSDFLAKVKKNQQKKISVSSRVSEAISLFDL